MHNMMNAPTSEHHVLTLATEAMPCQMAVQHICRTADPTFSEWVEFLVRPWADLSRLSPLEFVEFGYQRRGLLFDEDILARCLDATSEFSDSTQFSINVHPDSLRRDQFVKFIRRELAHRAISPNSIILELVEFGGPVNLMASRAALEALRDDGIRFALDDFGPGFSNLDLIGSGLIDFVKIDRSLVHLVDTHPGYRQLLAGLSEFANRTGLVLVAEGVENERQANVVRQIGIEWIQGFFYSRPHDAALAGARSEA